MNIYKYIYEYICVYLLPGLRYKPICLHETFLPYHKLCPKCDSYFLLLCYLIKTTAKFQTQTK